MWERTLVGDLEWGIMREYWFRYRRCGRRWVEWMDELIYVWLDGIMDGYCLSTVVEMKFVGEEVI